MYKCKLNLRELLVVLLSLFVMISLSPSFASIAEIKPSPNYLIILIPGTGGDDKSFTEDNGNLKKYLEEDLGLKGYVYGYDFPEIAGSNFENAKMLADPSRADSWFKKARQKFVHDYAADHNIQPEQVPLEVVPQKYILLAHSLGGLTAVTYITSDYYNDDVKKVIAIDSPLLGTDGTVYKKTFGSPEHIIGSVASEMVYAYVFLKMMSQPNPPTIFEIEFYSGLILPLWMTGTQWQFKELLGNYSMPGIVQTDPEGEFIANLKNAEVRPDTEPITYRLVSVRGTPTPDKETIKQLNALKNVPLVGGIYAPLRSSFWGLPTTQQKMLSVAYGVLLGGATFTLDGSFVIPYYSSRGEGVKIFEENAKRYEVLFYNQEIETYINEELPDLYAAIFAVHAFFGFNPGMNAWYWLPINALVYKAIGNIDSQEDNLLYNAFSHKWRSFYN